MESMRWYEIWVLSMIEVVGKSMRSTSQLQIVIYSDWTMVLDDLHNSWCRRLFPFLKFRELLNDLCSNLFIFRLSPSFCRWLGLATQTQLVCPPLIIESLIHLQTPLIQSRSTYFLKQNCVTYFILNSITFLLNRVIILFPIWQTCRGARSPTRVLFMLYTFTRSWSGLSDSCSFQWLCYIWQLQ